jgi:hypothetical protein
MGQRGPPKVMKNGSCSATNAPRRTALPFVISTEAQRSGEICGPFLEGFFVEQGALQISPLRYAPIGISHWVSRIKRNFSNPDIAYKPAFRDRIRLRIAPSIRLKKAHFRSEPV